MSNKKFYILINEDVEKMTLGLNTNLLYILVASSAGKDAKIIRIDENPNFPHQLSNFYDIDHQNAQLALAEYSKINESIRIKAKNNEIFTTTTLGNWLETNKIALFSRKNNEDKIEKIPKDSAILNRVEPMKSPFPPEGNKNIDEFLKNLLSLFPKIHAPADLSDKEIIENLSTPTKIFNTDFYPQESDLLAQNIDYAITKYRELYPKTKSAKIVIKPRDSAQSLGVIALEFIENGAIKSFDDAQKQQKNQQYQIDKNIFIDARELQLVVKELCRQQCAQKTLKDFYGKSLIIQPFLEGIKIGDFRSIIFKNRDGKFEVVGSVFRKKNSFSQGFTTSATAGQATPSDTKKFDHILRPFNQKIIDYLNDNLEKYKSVHFVGADIIAKDEGASELFLGEMNMHCPALISMIGENFAEAMRIIKNQILSI